MSSSSSSLFSIWLVFIPSIDFYDVVSVSLFRAHTAPPSPWCFTSQSISFLIQTHIVFRWRERKNNIIHIMLLLLFAHPEYFAIATQLFRYWQFYREAERLQIVCGSAENQFRFWILHIFSIGFKSIYTQLICE